MQKFNGRPMDTSDRLPKEIRTYDFLDSLHISYDRVDHEHADTMEVCTAIESSLGAKICKNLFLANRQQTAFYLLMMPGDKTFKTKDLSAQIGSSRLSFGTPQYMEQLLDITPGSVSVLGLMNDHDHRVTLLMDEDLLEEEYIGCHPCINTSSLCIRTEDLLHKIIPALGYTPTMVKL